MVSFDSLGPASPGNRTIQHIRLIFMENFVSPTLALVVNVFALALARKPIPEIAETLHLPYHFVQKLLEGNAPEWEELRTPQIADGLRKLGFKSKKIPCAVTAACRRFKGRTLLPMPFEAPHPVLNPQDTHRMSPAQVKELFEAEKQAAYEWNQCYELRQKIHPALLELNGTPPTRARARDLAADIEAHYDEHAKRAMAYYRFKRAAAARYMGSRYDYEVRPAHMKLYLRRTGQPEDGATVPPFDRTARGLRKSVNRKRAEAVEAEYAGLVRVFVDYDQTANNAFARADVASSSPAH